MYYLADDKLMKETLRLTGLRTKREAVELGLRTIVRLRRQEEIRRFRGKLNWQGDLDASVWIDYFRGIQSSQTDRLHVLLGNEPIATGDLVLTEVLRGFGSAQDFNQGKKLLTSLPIIELVGGDVANEACPPRRGASGGLSEAA
jgi:hypothetical protein